MPRYVSDQNKVVLLLESGTYGVTSGTAGGGLWLGEVTDHSVEDSENLLEDRFLGASTRSVSEYAPGPRDIKGKITYNIQDMRLPFIAIGSINEAGAAGHYIHYVNQVNTNSWQNPFCSGTNQLNAPMSFGLEDSKTAGNSGSVFLRTIKGAVIDTMTISATQGEKVTCDIDYIAQNMFYSGGTSSLTATVATTTPYLWNNCTLTVSGTSVQTAKEVSLEVKQNITGPHYLNGSRDIAAPYFGNRENTLKVSLDLDDQAGTLLYSLYKNNATFNTTFDLNGDVTAGSLHTIFFLSGCKVAKADVPSVVEGAVEASFDIVCPTIIGSSIDTVAKYNPW